MLLASPLLFALLPLIHGLVEDKQMHKADNAAIRLKPMDMLLGHRPMLFHPFKDLFTNFDESADRSPMWSRDNAPNVCNETVVQKFEDKEDKGKVVPEEHQGEGDTSPKSGVAKAVVKEDSEDRMEEIDVGDVKAKVSAKSVFKSVTSVCSSNVTYQKCKVITNDQATTTSFYCCEGFTRSFRDHGCPKKVEKDEKSTSKSGTDLPGSDGGDEEDSNGEDGEEEEEEQVEENDANDDNAPDLKDGSEIEIDNSVA